MVVVVVVVVLHKLIVLWLWLWLTNSHFAHPWYFYQFTMDSWISIFLALIFFSGLLFYYGYLLCAEACLFCKLERQEIIRLVTKMVHSGWRIAKISGKWKIIDELIWKLSACDSFSPVSEIWISIFVLKLFFLIFFWLSTL